MDPVDNIEDVATELGVVVEPVVATTDDGVTGDTATEQVELLHPTLTEECVNLINMAKEADGGNITAANQLLDTDFKVPKSNFKLAMDDLIKFDSNLGYVWFLLATIYKYGFTNDTIDFKAAVNYYHMIMNKYSEDNGTNVEYTKMKTIIEEHLKTVDEYGYIYDLIKIEPVNAALEEENKKLEEELKYWELEHTKAVYSPGKPGYLDAQASFQSTNKERSATSE